MKGLGLAAGLAAGVMEGKRSAELAKERKEDRAVMNDLRRARIDSLRGGAPSASMPTAAARGTMGQNENDIAEADTAAGVRAGVTDMAPEGMGYDAREEFRDGGMVGYRDGGLVGGHPNASRTSSSWQSKSFKK